MKSTLHIVLLTLLFGPSPLYAQQGSLETGSLDNPEVISLHADQPRFPLLPYNKADLALSENTQSSTYIQSLNGTWRAKTYSTPTQIDTLLTAPQADLGSWTSVQVPGTKHETAWATIYRTEFTRPFAWIDREVFIHVGNVSRAYYLFVNGQQVGYFEDSKSAAEFNITKFATEGKNHLAIIAYAHPAAERLENQTKVQGTGLDQDFYIFSQPKVRMRDYVVDTRFTADGANGLLGLGVIVKSHLLNPKEVTVHYELYAPDSTKILWGKRDARFDMRGEDTVRFFESIPQIESWSHESPKLYTVALKLQHEGRFTEYTTIRIGFREVTYGNQGITINGQPVELRPLDYICPATELLIRSDFDNFKRWGVNLLRVQNFPQPQLFYNLCDEYGLYVCDQANLDTHLSDASLKIGGNPANDTIWEQGYAERILHMYYASKNHPSVIMFSLGAKAGRGYSMYEAYLRLKEVEHQRPVIYEGAGAEWNTDFVVGQPAGRHPSDQRYTLRFGTQQQWQASQNPPLKITLSADNLDLGRVFIENGYHIASLNNFMVGYTLLSGRKTVKEGVILTPLAAGARESIQASLEGLEPGKYTLMIHVSETSDLPWAKSGDRIAEISHELVIPKPQK